MMPRDWEKDARVIGRRYGFTKYAEVMGAAWIAAWRVDEEWRPDGGAGRRTFFCRELEAELRRDLPRRSVQLARCVELHGDDAGIAAVEKEAEEPARSEALARRRIAALPPQERTAAELVVRGGDANDVARAFCVGRRRALQIFASAAERLRRQGDLFAEAA